MCKSTCYYVKINSKWIRDLSVITKTIKAFKEHKNVNLHEFGLGNSFWYMTFLIYDTLNISNQRRDR